MKPYIVAVDSEGLNYVKGPDDGGQCSYHGGYMNPKTRFQTIDHALVVADMMNMAFDQGYKNAQSEFRKVIGIK